jgi:hypothetical protein
LSYSLSVELSLAADLDVLVIDRYKLHKMERFAFRTAEVDLARPRNLRLTLQTPELRIDEFHVAAVDVDPGLNLRLCFHALELNVEISFNPSSESSFEMKQAHSLWNIIIIILLLLSLGPSVYARS